MPVKERLIEFIKFKNLPVNRFEKICGLSTGYISNMRVSIQPGKASSIAHNFPELNTGWLLTGEGEMLRNEKPNNDGTLSTDISRCLDIIKEKDRMMYDLLKNKDDQMKNKDDQMKEKDAQMNRMLEMLENRIKL